MKKEIDLKFIENEYFQILTVYTNGKNEKQLLMIIKIGEINYLKTEAYKTKITYKVLKDKKVIKETRNLLEAIKYYNTIEFN